MPILLSWYFKKNLVLPFRIAAHQKKPALPIHPETSSSTKVYVENTGWIVLLKTEMVQQVHHLGRHTNIAGFFKEVILKN